MTICISLGKCLFKISRGLDHKCSHHRIETVIMSHDRGASESYDGNHIAINKINTLYTLNLYNVVCNYIPIKNQSIPFDLKSIEWEDIKWTK